MLSILYILGANLQTERFQVGIELAVYTNQLILVYAFLSVGHVQRGVCWEED